MPGIGLGLGLGLNMGGGAALPNPLEILGSALKGRWLADDAVARGKITIATGVSSWKDEIAAIDLVQATGGAQPIWTATGHKGLYGNVAFDGSDDYLRIGSVPASFPVGTNTSEIWINGSQDALPADTTSRTAFGYGQTSTNTRLLQRAVVTGTNRGRANAQGTSATHTAVDLSGRHAIRAQFVNASIVADVDGVAGVVATPTLATVATLVTMGATTATSPGGFWQGGINEVLVVNRVTTAAEQAALFAYFAARN